jgi:hypothetical protein
MECLQQVWYHLDIDHLLFASRYHITYSAYNIFFKEERARILSQEGLLSNSGVSASAEGRKNVGFESLAKTIGARWKIMSSEEERAPYKEKAAVSFSTLYRLHCAHYVVLI